MISTDSREALAKAHSYMCDIEKGKPCPKDGLESYWANNGVTTDNPAKPIEVNVDRITKNYGIDFKQPFLADWLCNKSISPISANSILNGRTQIGSDTPITISFQEALLFVVTLINSSLETNTKDLRDSNARLVPVKSFLSPAEKKIFFAISNMEFPGFDSLPTPTQYASPFCSADSFRNRYWLGAALAVLHAEGVIHAYGEKGYDFWVQV